MMRWDEGYLHEDFAVFEAVGLSALERAQLLDLGGPCARAVRLRYSSYANVAFVATSVFSPQGAQPDASCPDAAATAYAGIDSDGPDKAEGYDFIRIELGSFQPDKCLGILNEGVSCLKTGGFVVLHLTGATLEGVDTTHRQLVDSGLSNIRLAHFFRDGPGTVISTYFVAQKLKGALPAFPYLGTLFPQADNVCASDADVLVVGGKAELVPLREEHLGYVMAIELEVFSSPWTPLAFAMELRHNEQAQYWVLRDEDAPVMGYVGIWQAGARAFIVRIAVAAQHQRNGWGRAMLMSIFDFIAAHGVEEVLLEVRKSNTAALAFYTSMGFTMLDRLQGYYTAPVEDALILSKKIGRTGLPS